MRDYDGLRALDPQCEEMDLRPRVKHWHCGGCGATWPKADGVVCPGCQCNTSTLRDHGLLSEVELPA